MEIARERSRFPVVASLHPKSCATLLSSSETKDEKVSVKASYFANRKGKKLVFRVQIYTRGPHILAKLVLEGALG